MAQKVNFMCTAFRDGFQSVYGARVLTPDFLPALEAARDAGIDYFEAGGGARFQSLYFYCNEDAFAMMDSFRGTVGPKANLQTLARGVNVVGLDATVCLLASGTPVLPANRGAFDLIRSDSDHRSKHVLRTNFCQEHGRRFRVIESPERGNKQFSPENRLFSYGDIK